MENINANALATINQDNNNSNNKQREDSTMNNDSSPNVKDAFAQSGSSPTENEILGIALDYAKNGWPVLPLHNPTSNVQCSCHKSACQSVGKHPRTLHGLKDATTDEGRIKSWWRMFPGSNIGIATGRQTGFVVLDVDPIHGGDKNLTNLEDEYGELPETLETVTGSGGRHIFFRLPEGGLRGSVGKIVDGLDIRGDGNYIVAPPSLHASGNRYTWSNNSAIAPMPEWLLDFASRRTRGSHVASGECISEGKRNSTLASMAGGMRHSGFDEPDIEAALLGVNTRRCEPPLTDDEVCRIAASIARYEQGTLKEQTAISKSDKTCLSKPASTNDRKIVFLSASDLLSREYSESKWAVSGLLSEGATIFAGPPKAGKSFLALGLAIAIACGGRALGSIPVAEGDVLYLSLEDGEKRLQQRLRQMLGEEDVPKRLTFACQSPRIDEGGLEAIEDWLQGHNGARLIVIDTLKRVRPLERNTKRLYDNDYNAVSSLNDLAQTYGVAILLIHHTIKLISEADWFSDISGSLGLSAGVDTAMLLRRSRGETKGTLCVAGRDIDDQAMDVQFDGVIQGWRLLGDALTKLATKVNNWLGEAQAMGLTRSEINKKNGGRSEGVAEALRELAGRGFAASKSIPTGGKAQERWYSKALMPSNHIDDNDDNDDVSLGEPCTPTSSISSTSSIYRNDESVSP